MKTNQFILNVAFGTEFARKAEQKGFKKLNKRYYSVQKFVTPSERKAYLKGLEDSNGWNEFYAAIPKNEIIKNDKEPKQNAWDFVERNYPDYSHCDTIVYADDLQKIIDGELNGNALKLWEDDFEKDKEKVQAEYNNVHKEIYEKAITNYLVKNEQETPLHVHTIIDIEKKGLTMGFINKIKAMETYEDQILKEHLFSVDYITEKLKANKILLTLQEITLLKGIKTEMEKQGAIYFRMVSN